MPQPLKVFLCHAHSDKDTVKSLYTRLKREGVDVWLDKEKLLPGADWEYEIRKAVRESDVVIVCLSKQFNQAGFRQKEVRIALEEADKKPEGEIFIIPARLEECDNLPSLDRWHWVDLFEDDGFQRLIRALRIRADKIGAALRQRGATLPRQKKNPEQQDAEKESIEQARKDAEEQERQKLVKEHADREDAEKTDNERLAREAADKAIREKEERETAEKAAREKEERKKVEREAADRIAREKAEREKIELARAKQEEREKPKTKESVLKPAPVLEKKLKSLTTPPPKTNLRRLGIGGIIFASLLIVIFTGNYLIETLVPTQLIDPNVTATIDTTATQDAESTSAAVLAATNSQNTAYAMQTLISLPTVTPAPGIGSTQVSEKDGMVMVFVPAGEFTMGSDTGESDEQPVHTINLDAFWIDQTEVTNAMFAAFLSENENQSEGGVTWLDASDTDARIVLDGSQWVVKDGYADHPVTEVSWFGAKAYCAWAGRELPTEAQWEKAARGTDGRTYPWGEGIDCNKANYNSSCVGDTSKVGSYKDGASIYGVLDMAGSVWEWVGDWYSDVYYQSSPSSNPLGPDTGQYRVLRGGSWSSGDYGVRSAYRYWSDPSLTSSDIGFRCSLSP